jgi:hypothetical protein
VNAPIRACRLLGALIGVALLVAACGSSRRDEGGLSATASPFTVGGCACVSSGTCAALTYSDIPADGQYYVTTFGGGSETGPMSCGGTADGTWAYVADRARFGCGAKVLVETAGKHCVAEVADCGPNRCVEEAASGSCGSHFPVLDVSPFITKYLMGVSATGWSEKKLVTTSLLDGSSGVGCPGTPVGGSAGSGGSGGTGGTGGSPSGGGSGGSGATASGGSPSSGGSGGGTASCTAPTCTGCSDCYTQCMCDINDTGICTSSCFAGGGGSSGSGGAGVGGGAPTSCSPPVCDTCASCYDQCVCDGTSPDSCIQICAPSDTGGGGGTDPTGSCSAPDCSGCADCYDICVCQSGNVPACTKACEKADAPGTKTATVAAPPVASSGSCGAASIAGSSRGTQGRVGFLFGALAGLALIRGRRRRSARHGGIGSSLSS